MKHSRPKKYDINQQDIRVLERYYPIDKENYLVSVRFHYETVEELVEAPAAAGFHAPLKPDLFDALQETIAKFPVPYRFHIELAIDDLQGHSPAELVHSFQDSVEMKQISKRLLTRRVLFLSALFVLIGFFILGVMALASEQGWFGSGFTAALFAEAVDIVGTVFLWEAATMLFLKSSEQSVSDPGIRRRIAALSIVTADGTPLLSVTHDQLFQRMNRTHKLNQLARTGLLLSSCGFFVTGFNSLLQQIQLVSTVSPDDQTYLPVLQVVLLLFSLCQMVSGVGGFYLFWGRRNLFTAFSKGYAYCMSVIIGLLLMVAFSIYSLRELLLFLSSFNITILYILSLFLNEKTLNPRTNGGQQERHP